MKLYVLNDLHYAPITGFITNTLEEMKNLPSFNTKDILYKSKTGDVFISEAGDVYLESPKNSLTQIANTVPDTVEFNTMLVNKRDKESWDEMFKRDGLMLLINTRILNRDGLWYNEDTGIVSHSQMFAKTPFRNETGYILFETNDPRLYMNIHKAAFYYNGRDFEQVELSKESWVEFNMDVGEIYTDVHSWFMEKITKPKDKLDDGDFPEAVLKNIEKRKGVKAKKMNCLESDAIAGYDTLQRGLAKQQNFHNHVVPREKALDKATEMIIDNNTSNPDILFYKNMFLSISKRIISTSLSSLNHLVRNNTPYILIELMNDSGFANSRGEYFKLDYKVYVPGGRTKHTNFPLNYTDLHGKTDMDIILLFKHYTDAHSKSLTPEAVEPIQFKFVNDMFLVSTQYPHIWVNSDNGRPYTEHGEEYTVALSLDKALTPFKSVEPNWGEKDILRSVVPIPGRTDVVVNRLSNSLIDPNTLLSMGLVDDINMPISKNALLKRKPKRAASENVSMGINKANDKYYFNINDVELNYIYDRDKDAFGWSHSFNMLFEDVSMNMCRLKDLEIKDPICKFDREHNQAIVDIDASTDLVFRIIGTGK